ncbi:MAG TPA: VanZ family protein [Blastococcus sp.]
MDVDPRAAGGHPAADDRWLTSALGAALVAVAVLTLLPEGHGWAWGSPLAELRWYATGLTDEPTLLQLTGNLGLLAAPAALAVLRCPALGRPARLAAVGLATGALIETLQWMLPLGRVVSPVDALLNAAGAVIAGLLTTRLRPRRVPARPGTAARAVGTTA